MKDEKKFRRWLERGKTLLIAALTISALFLVYLSPLVQDSGLSALFASGSAAGPSNPHAPASLSAAAIPIRMAVGSDTGLYGVQYNPSATDSLFDTAGPLLGEALSTAGQPESLTQKQWRTLLSGQCIYFDFNCPIPLSSLCAWLKDGAENETLTAFARIIILAPASDGTLSLCYQQSGDGGYFRCATALDVSLHLIPIIDSVTPNNAFFAFQDSSLPNILAPATLFTGEEINALTYLSSNPLSPVGGESLSQLLEALSFTSQNQADVSGGSIYVDGEDTLRLSADGQEVYYLASGEGKYAAGKGLTSAIDAAWNLAETSLGALCGEARLYLSSAQAGPEEGSYTITFGYALNGCTVYLYDQGWAAQFQVRNGFVSEFTLWPRAYTSTGQQALLLPADKAAAALTALSSTPRELVIQYRDNGGESVEPGWVAR